MTPRPLIAYVPFHDARKWQAEGMRTRDAHVLEELQMLLKGHALVVVDRPTCLAEFAKLRGQWRAKGHKLRRSWDWSATRLATNVTATDQLLLEPGFRNGSFHTWLRTAYGSARYARRITDLISEADHSETHLWLCHPFAARLRHAIPHSRLFFDAFDNFAIHPELSEAARQSAAQGYRELSEAADRIVVNSSATQEYFWRAFQRESLLVTNGAKPEVFSKARGRPPSGVTPPIIGYAGKLGLRIDVDLLLRLADSMEHVTVVLAGQVLNRSWVRRLLRHPRIRYIHDLHYEALPGFIKACDVCIVPHRVGYGENHGDATKIYEYLSAGKPVVSTAIGGTSSFGSRIIVARDSAAFIAGVRDVLNGSRVPDSRLLPQETWQARVSEMCKYFGLAVAPYPESLAP